MYPGGNVLLSLSLTLSVSFFPPLALFVLLFHHTARSLANLFVSLWSTTVYACK